jgi:uncharacterized membrane protein
MNKTKPLFGIIIAIGFLYLGYYLTQKDQEYQVIIGYVTIIFWTIVLLFALFKKLTTKKQATKNEISYLQNK